jgi:response regulator RpfG family c-di-GMP phosphodiesterase
MQHAEVFDYIKKESGKHFDPDVVAAFVARNKAFLKTSLKYADDVE